MSGILEYDPNNSGGDWWLTAENYEALEAAGWGVTWAYQHAMALFPVSIKRYGNGVDVTESNTRTPGLSWLGAEAGQCAKRFGSAREGVAEWERITGQNAGDIGCTCCGPPHSFEWHDDDGHTDYISPEIPDRVDIWGDDA